MIARVLAAALLAAGLAAPGLAAGTGAGGEASASEMTDSQTTAAERVLARALDAVTEIAAELEGVRTGAVAPADATLAIRGRRAELDLHLLVWRNASAEERAAARAARADAWTAAEARIADAEAGFEAMERPAYEVAEALRGPPTLADFAREPPIETLSGVYAQGFETSDFTVLGEAGSASGPGPLWLEASEDAWDALNEQPRVGQGRGGRLLLALEVEGWIETGDGRGYGHLGAYPGRVYVERVVAARPLDETEYEALRARADDGSPSPEHD